MANAGKPDIIEFNSTVIRKLFYRIFLCTLIIGCTVAPLKLFFQDLSKSFPEGTIISASTQQPVTFDELMNDLSGVQVIYIGEEHTDRTHHEIQVKIIKEIHKARPQVAIGLEMVDHTYQPILDRWSDGKLDRQNFLEKVHWYANWRFDFELYQNIFSFIKENKIKVLGLNIPRQIPPKIRLGGIENLSDDDKRYLPRNIDTTNKLHRDYVELTFRQHQSMSKKKFASFDYFYLAMCVWDEAMAETIAEHLGGDVMIVLAGNGHIIHKFGIPDRAYTRTKAAFRTIYLASAGSQAELSYADYIWVTPPRGQRH
jgi:uncharacterized iron-regulated protein